MKAPQPWQGPKRPYDLVKEFVIALVVVSVLSIVLAAVLSSPDQKGVTLQTWARQNPSDFVATAVTELDGTSASASYGPPYNHAGAGQSIFFLHPQSWVGTRQSANPPVDFVLQPLSTVTTDPSLMTALSVYNRADASQQTAWAANYDKAIAAVADGDPAKVTPGDYGPVPTMTAALLHLAQVGALDSQLVSRGPGFYQDNYTRPLLFLSDGSYLADLAATDHLQGTQWGMMNETGNYPGQAWLWLYTMWYQISPFNHSGNADALVWATMMILSLGLILVPFIPGLRSLPRRIPLYRIIWRDYYRQQAVGPYPTAPPCPTFHLTETVSRRP